MPEYKVNRPHIGDESYAVGDIRTADAANVAHLVRSGVLTPVENKVDAPSESKAQTKAAKGKK